MSIRSYLTYKAHVHAFDAGVVIHNTVGVCYYTYSNLDEIKRCHHSVTWSVYAGVVNMKCTLKTDSSETL